MIKHGMSATKVRFFERDEAAEVKTKLAAWGKPGRKFYRQAFEMSNRIKLTDRK
jgi:hypothetical protein